MRAPKTAVEKRASLIIKYRKLKVNKKEKEGNKTTYFLSRGASNYVFLCARAILKFYHSEPFQFPWIKASDPVSKILGARRGDILKMTAHSETTGTYVTYRYVAVAHITCISARYGCKG